MACTAAPPAAVPALAGAALPAGAAAAAVAEPAANAAEASPKKRQRAPKIDIDAAIAVYQQEVKKAAKLMAEARRSAKNEKRKKQRLMKKASTLSQDDLERIATLKRVGLWNPALGAPAAEAGDGVPALVDGEAAPATPVAAQLPAGAATPVASAAAAAHGSEEERSDAEAVEE